MELQNGHPQIQELTAYDELFWDIFPDGHSATLFHHPWHVDHEKYPNGIADMAGHWAGARILARVALFDHREDIHPGHVYWHSHREDVTYRIYQLLPEQNQALIDFYSAESEPQTCPLPLLSDGSNLNRIDPEEPVAESDVYRNLWERKEKPVQLNDQRLRDVWDRIEFPTRGQVRCLLEGQGEETQV